MAAPPDAHQSRSALTGLAGVVDATAGRGAAAGLALASRLRRKRIFHPHGRGFVATLIAEPSGSVGAALLDDAASHRCIVRLSRGIGLPDGTQDILGVGLRILDAGDAIAQDLLFATAVGEGAASRHVLAPAPSFAHRPFSTILPYRTPLGLVSLTLHAREADARGLSTLAASAAAFEAGRLTFALRATMPGEDPSHVGILVCDRRLSDDESEDLAFNPYHADGDLRPAGVLNALRRRAYGASQSARPTDGWSQEQPRP